MADPNSPSTPSDDPSLSTTKESPHSADSDTMDPILLDEEENALQEGEAENIVTAPKQPFTRYNDLKKFNGQLYSGMAIGGSHTWNYDPGTWKETKEEPDLWRIDYQTNKRRARNAPRGSGAPVGTEYHWLIVGHQHVRKIDANTYETHLTGSKYKLAHKSATARTWSIPTVRDQRRREMELLEDARNRVQGLPPVLSSEKVKVDRREKGQQSLDSLFAKAKEDGPGSRKRKKI